MNLFYRILFLLTWIIVLSGCTQRNDSSGRATVTGKFTDHLLGAQNKTYSVITILVPNIILGGMTEYQTTVEPDGSFSMEIPIVSPAYAEVGVDLEKYDNYILISPGKTISLDLFMDEAGRLSLHGLKGIELKMEDLKNIGNVGNKVRIAAMEGLNSPKLTFSSTPKAYADSMLIRMEKDFEIIYKDSVLSENHKKLYRNSLAQFYLNLFFEYEDNMRLRYINQQDEKEDMTETFVPQKPDKSYYSFLKHFDLNNPPQLTDMYYPVNLRLILSQTELNIPNIGDTQISEWLNEVKLILSELTGIDSGLFYDMLVAEAYINQFRNDLNPLSERQKENILNYFSNPSFADILFAENKKIVLRLMQIERNKNTNVIVNETPSVEKGELLDAIISRYKGKVVLIDFWATWCAPCMQAMEEMKSIKEEMKDKNISFVYITYISSPKGLWEKKIQEIGGEHYYLSVKEWENIYSSKIYGFKGIPTYLLIDSSGILKNKISGYPGNEKMQAMIEKLRLISEHL